MVSGTVFSPKTGMFRGVCESDSLIKIKMKY